MAQAEEKTADVSEEEEERREWYKDVLRLSLIDQDISAEEYALLERVRLKLRLSELTHAEILDEVGWSVQEFEELRNQKVEVIINECVVCLDQASSFLVMGCFHLCLCKECSDLFQPGEPCPKCREPIKEIRQTFA